MDAMVSARVPVEIKKRGDRKLKEIGSSATELVNAAYRYVLDEGKLPQAGDVDSSGVPRTKTLTGEDAQRFCKQWASRAVLKAPSYTGENFKDLLNQAREERYARLA